MDRVRIAHRSVAASLICFAMMPISAAVGSAMHCVAPTVSTRFNFPLTQTAYHLASRRLLTIVALGSSSTAGAGASSPANTYPSRLAVELAQLFPSQPMKVLNRGTNGDQAVDMLARFDKSVVAEHPDLVLWQLGTNAVLRDDQQSAASGPLIRHGIQQMKSIGAEVVLVDPQFAPKVIVKPGIEEMIASISLAAEQESVDVFHRFALMRHWHEAEDMPFEAFLSADQLHMNDWSYGCLAKVLASAIADAASLDQKPR